ncbi:hypothetical protein QBC33DRAFT_41419 [Phialemonium atrogriseum]|uniref:SUN domain-containing protein n=1 Tax=Phialemonium atrogriseum TaxID=1093897 RepID=A0AAJ0FMM4_9PEZI|nr:uncharacterized protein QBC33DRAFT_41419 [Phialemonium atrogriseum]KAK1768014.1 hypothetical protein QBC33DRAFT_41419 [Phialemonium atrogriseum]
MPPKRRRPTADDGAERSDDPPQTRSAAITSRLTPLQAKHSTSYGSPAPVLPLRDSGKYGANLKGATRDIFAAVRKENKQAKLDQGLTHGEVVRESESPAPPSEPVDEADTLKRQQEEEEAIRLQEAEEAARQRVLEERAVRRRDLADKVARREAARKQEAEEEAARQREAEEEAVRQREAEAEAAQQQQAEEEAARQQAEVDMENRLQEAEAARRTEQEREVKRKSMLRDIQEEEGYDEQEDGGYDEQEDEQEQDQGVHLPDDVQRFARSEIWEAAAGGSRLGAFRKRPTPESAPTSSPKRAKKDHTPSHNPTDDRRGPGNLSDPSEFLGLTGRSFIEESNVFKDAELQTPAGSSVMGDTPTRNRQTAIPVAGPRDGGLASNILPVSRESRPRLRSSAFPAQLPQPATDASVASSGKPVTMEHEAETGHPAAQRRPSAPTGNRPTENNGPILHRRGRSKRAEPGITQNSREEDPVAASPGRGRPLPASGDLLSNRPVFPPPATGGGETESQAASSSGVRLQQSSPRRRDKDQASPAPPSPRIPNPLHASKAISGVDSVQESDPLPALYSRQWYLYYAKHVSRILLSTAHNFLYWVACLVLTLFVLRLWYRVGSPELENSRVNNTLEWRGWTDWKHNFAQFVPYTLSHPLGCITDDEYNVLNYFVKSQSDQLSELSKTSQVTSLAIEKLESILPQTVLVKQDKKTKKLIISQDFWHALKDEIQKEQSILTLQTSKDGTDDISDHHWSALLKRFKVHGVPGQDRSADDVTSIVERTLSSSWETWLKNNHEKVNEILEPSSLKDFSAATEQKVLSHAEELIQERLSAKGLKDVVVTKDEFVREVERNLEAYKGGIEAELEDLRDKLGDMVENAVKPSEPASNSAGLSRSEVIALTNDIVRKAIGDVHLEAAAKGNIGTNFEAELGRRVNYFGLGNGASIDVSLTSPTYQPPTKPPIGSSSWLKFKSPSFRPEKSAALTSWEEAGHCWCAANRFKDSITHPADISIKLPESIIPENVVIEHIDPSATLDPKAMPKKIEVWAIIDEHSRREKAYNFMMAQYPDTKSDHPLIRRGFLKIGEFTYEHNSATNGVQVYRVSSEFAKMDSMTDHVLIRAVSNYGADHTCFYRVRLYGEPRDLEDTEHIPA